LARASVSIFLAVGILAAAEASGEAQETGKVGPPLETVRAFGDDFRLVGIDVSAQGRVFATLENICQRPSKLSWADGFSISNGYLYIADSHLWEVAFKNNLPRSGPFSFFEVKLPH
jgi:hypothetical protein